MNVPVTAFQANPLSFLLIKKGKITHIISLLI